MQVGEDPFTKMQKDKAARVKSTDKRQLANTKNALKKAGKGGCAFNPQAGSSTPRAWQWPACKEERAQG